MPLIKPEVQNILRVAGLEKEASSEGNISDRLDRAGLSQDNLAELLSDIARGSGNEGLKLRAIETALKAHGALKESAPQSPSFTIVIQPSGENSNPPSVNPILFPRQSFKANEPLEVISPNKEN